MNLAQILGELPAVNVMPGDAQGTWVLCVCRDCGGAYDYTEIAAHLQSAHGMSREDADVYVAYLMGGPREVRQMNSQRVEVVA